jgi:hypothetical protein
MYIKYYKKIYIINLSLTYIQFNDDTFNKVKIFFIDITIYQLNGNYIIIY